MNVKGYDCWAIVTSHKQKAQRLLLQIDKEQQAKGIKSIKLYQDDCYAEIIYEDGKYIKWIIPSCSSKGFRFHHLWCDKDIDKEILKCIFLPMMLDMDEEDIIWI